jgi:hypothetical protein
MIALVIVILSIIILALLLRPEQSNFGQYNNLGNILCDYFYYMGLAWSKGEDFEWQRPRDDGFYQHLPKTLPPPRDANIVWNEFGPSDGPTVNDISWLGIPEFWQSMKPYINEILDEALTKEGLKPENPSNVIHFRCSDTPFNKWDGYMLPKYSFYKKLGLKDVEIVNCSTHLAGEKEQEACGKYVDLLQTELENEGVHVTTSCGKIDGDFAKMFYAPILVTTGSSMSFFAGMFNDREFIKPSKEEYLHHSSVRTYYDVDVVHEQLKSP